MKVGIIICDRYRSCGGGKVKFIPKRYGVPVVVGTHPIPEKYRRVHRDLPSWPRLEGCPSLLATEEVRKAYD